MYIVDHIFGYRSKKFIRAHLESSAHVHGTESEAENLTFENNVLLQCHKVLYKLHMVIEGLLKDKRVSTKAYKVDADQRGYGL